MSAHAKPRRRQYPPYQARMIETAAFVVAFIAGVPLWNWAVSR